MFVGRGGGLWLMLGGCGLGGSRGRVSELGKGSDEKSRGSFLTQLDNRYFSEPSRELGRYSQRGCKLSWPL